MSKPRIQRRDVHGLILLDKPVGYTSNQALQRVKYLFKARKAGHTGSLDPLATGLLPLCFGEATKVSAFLLDADKQYRTVCRLGVTTTTADAEGEVTETRPVPELDDDLIEAVLERFRGPIEQIPPMYSALKHQGQRLYDLARKGQEVERAPRPVTIHQLHCLARTGDTLTLDVSCSKGTYIRTLVEDIGRALGCGAHVIELRRVGLTPFETPRMVTLQQLEALAEQGPEALDGALHPADEALMHWPEVHLDADSAFYLTQGQAVFVPGLARAGWLRLYGPGDRFLGIGQLQDDGRLAPKRLMIPTNSE
ncbi:tRNA pseudouridine(55) synthase TruB [Ectothiorhodospira shaposhnikovii]|uniref:tRNA pseudouridine(55) synthase TruB n=1 Tax=Ectothiorhodospira shaposhnikovii TaxID=1054 RepID=UPI00190845CE|nr:tRNA pseudouridine(55) synthase TruB [Ectothiorhodospira shaposhnikovii]MBK1672183.1 tRNA pseudouridine(55) synthase TruB [Ectothiorhodospira shaposhnikovii]